MSRTPTGSINKRSVTSYRIQHKKETYATCRTYEQAYYVRQELQKCNWDKNKVPEILADYPKWYTQLLYFYQHIGKVKNNNGEWTGKWKVVIPVQYTETGGTEYIQYSKLEDALYERDYLKEYNWDYENLVYNINDEENPYYEMELPPYPQRRIIGVSERKTYTDELNKLKEVILDGVTNQMEAAKIIDSNVVTVRNWLNRYNISWRDFKELVLSGEDIWTVLELDEKIYQPDLSPSMPSNYTGYVHRKKSKRSPYVVCRKGVYYGAYKDKKTAKKVVKELMECNWDKNELPRIKERVGFAPFLNTKRWVYPANKGKSWTVRKKDKNRKMVNYGHYTDKRIAEKVRDLLVENNWDKSRLQEFRNIAESHYMEAGK